MRENDGFIGHVEDYLVEFDGDTPLPGRVLDAIHAQLPRTRQAKARPGFKRMPPMLSTISSRAPLGIAAAIIILAVLVGATFMNRSQPGVGAAPASTSPRPTIESPEPSAGPNSGLPMMTGAELTSCPGITDEPACFEPGSYQLGTTVAWPAVVTMDVPAGWWPYIGGGTDQLGVLVQTEDVSNGSGWGVIFTTIGSLSLDPCDTTAGMVDSDGRTLRELYDTIARWPGFIATDQQPVVDGEFEAIEFSLSSTKGTAECPAPIMWTSLNSLVIDAYPMLNEQGRRHETTFRIYDVDGKPLVVASMNFPETSPHEEANGHPFDPAAHADDLAELNGIVDSIQVSSPGGGAN